jgi:hypothetical protein
LTIRRFGIAALAVAGALATGAADRPSSLDGVTIRDAS